MLHCLLEGGEGLGKVTLSPRRRRRPRQGYTVSSKAEKAVVDARLVAAIHQITHTCESQSHANDSTHDVE